jgi:uncharacterized protein (TIGR02217 family)
MSTVVFVPPVGTGWPITRTPSWNTGLQQAISGRECRLAFQTFPRWKYELTINVARSSAAYQSTEYQYVVGFFNALQGQASSFLYQDADDNAVTGQTIGTGNGTQTAFQLIRTFGGFIEPVLAPNTTATINVYLNGVIQTSGYTVSGWGTTNPGVVTFASAPGSGVAITADFSYYWPCRMSADDLATSLFMNQFYEIKKFTFISVKN